MSLAIRVSIVILLIVRCTSSALGHTATRLPKYQWSNPKRYGYIHLVVSFSSYIYISQEKSFHDYSKILWQSVMINLVYWNVWKLFRAFVRLLELVWTPKRWSYATKTIGAFWRGLWFDIPSLRRSTWNWLDLIMNKHDSYMNWH